MKDPGLVHKCLCLRGGSGALVLSEKCTVPALIWVHGLYPCDIEHDPELAIVEFPWLDLTVRTWSDSSGLAWYSVNPVACIKTRSRTPVVEAESHMLAVEWYCLLNNETCCSHTQTLFAE